MNNPVQIAIKLFETQCERCVTADEDVFLLALRDLVNMAGGNGQLQRCMDEIMKEANDWDKIFLEKTTAVKEEIVRLRNELVTAAPEMEGEPEKGDIPEFYPTIRHFDKLLSGERKPGIPLEPDQFDDPSINRKLLRIIDEISVRKFGEKINVPEDLRNGIERVESHLDWLQHEGQNFVRSHPGSVWDRIVSAVNEINPLPKSLGTPVDWDELMRAALHGIRFQKVLYGWNSRYSNVAPDASEREQYRHWKTYIINGLALLKSAVIVRLSTRATSDWVVRRYAARTSIYRYNELREALKRRQEVRSAKGKRPSIESFLVDDAAAYLFDMGFGVLTERHLGPGRLDIYEETLGVEVARDAILIEAKIYGSARDARVAVKRGLAQLYGYATSIESSFHPTENYLLMFRLSGPKMVFPREPVQIGEYSFRLVHIDLAARDESGNRSPEPVVLDIKKIAFGGLLKPMKSE